MDTNIDEKHVKMLLKEIAYLHSLLDIKKSQSLWDFLKKEYSILGPEFWAEADKIREGE